MKKTILIIALILSLMAICLTVGFLLGQESERSEWMNDIRDIRE